LQSDFIQDNNNRKKIAVYNYNLVIPFSWSNYSPLNSPGFSSGPSSSNRPIVASTVGSAGSPALSWPSLRGAYEFYSYINNGLLSFNFDFFNLHENSQPDTIIVNVYDPAGQQIFSQSLADQGQIQISLDKLTVGAYKVEVKASDNIITRKLVLADSRISFINKVWLVNGANLWTDSAKIKVKNVNPATRGNIVFAGQFFNIDQTYKQFVLTAAHPVIDGTAASQVAGGAVKNQAASQAAENQLVDSVKPSIYKISIGRGDYIIEADGVFSLAADSLFNPSFPKVSTDLDLNNIDYIIANYQPPLPGGEYQIATAEFSLSNAYREFGKNTFMISIPGLTTSAVESSQGITPAANDNLVPVGSAAGMEIKNIKIELQGKSLWNKVKEYWSKK
jgi:hypothetical protein